MSLKSELAGKNLRKQALAPFGLGHREADHVALAGLNINVASIATAIEALELLLVEKGVLQDNELMEKLREVARSKARNPLVGPSDD